MRFQLPEILRLRDFRNLWLGQAISQLGDAFYYVAFLFMVKKVTGDIAMVGYVGALETLPFLLFGPYAGIMADRMDRRRIMLLSDLICGAALVGFSVLVFFSGKPPVWSLMVMPFLLSSVRCFFMPAKSASIPALVPTSHLQRANAFSMGTQNIMLMSSLAFTAGVLALLYDKSPILFYTSTVTLNAVSFLASGYYIAKLPAILPDRKEDGPTHVLHDMKEGIAYLRTRRELNVLTVMLALFRLCVAPFFVVYLAANEKWFGDRPQTITWFEFSFFAGMVVMTAFAGRVNAVRPTMWFCASLGAVGIFVMGMAFTPNIPMFVFWNFACGLAVPLADIPIVTYIQKSVPDRFLGRVNSVRDMIATGVMPLGLVMGGQLVERFGVVIAFCVMGIGMAAAGFLTLLDRQFRSIRMPEDPPEKEVAAKLAVSAEPAAMVV